MNWRKFGLIPRMTHAEYRANLDGLNIFFGAVLGFVLAGTENLDQASFAVLLAGTAGIVISILYVTSSRRRATYLVLGAALIATMPRWLEGGVFGIPVLPANLQPTLMVWLLLTCLVEFLPRERSSAVAEAHSPPGVETSTG